MKICLMHSNNRKKSNVAGMGQREMGREGGERGKYVKYINMSIREVRQDWGGILWTKQGLRFGAVLNGILNIMRMEKLD